MKRAVTILVLIFGLISAISASGALLEGGGGYQVSQVADIFNGATGSIPANMYMYFGKLYFSATDGIHGAELWVYDGISAPQMIADIYSGAGGSYPSDLTTYKGKLYFSANDETYGRELWVYNGVTSPQLVMDINPIVYSAIQNETSGPAGSSPQYLTVYNDKLYFSATDGTYGLELWEYDGVSLPSMIKDIYSGSSSSAPKYLTVFNDKLYFTAQESTHGFELWVYNAVSDPYLVGDIYSGSNGSNPGYLTVYDNKLYFAASNGTNGIELMSLSTTNTLTIWDIYGGSGSSNPTDLIVFNGTLYFAASNATFGRELWHCVGTSCSLAANIVAGSTSSFPAWLTVFNDMLLFSADNGSAGTELMAYDGSTFPVLVSDIYSGASPSYPADLAVYKDKLFFKADDGVDGQELWEYGPQTLQDMFYSQSTYDGWVLETAENTNAGGLINTTNLVCNIGDDSLNRQFRTILHFNTSRLPDNAYVTKVSVQYKQHSTIGSDPYATHGVVWVDIKDGYFSNNPGLVGSDFGAGPSLGFAGWFTLYPSALAYPIYRSNLKAEAMQYLNVDGSTQFRLRFGMDDDNDNIADYIKIFCGDMPVPFNRPVLRVWYYYDPD